MTVDQANLEALNNKYPAVPAVVESEVESVIIAVSEDAYTAAHKLFDFLETHADQGFILATIDGDPSLHFSPGLDIDDQGRWQLAGQAIQLLANAAEDLRELIEAEAIKLPRRRQIEAKSEPIFFDEDERVLPSAGATGVRSAR